MPNFQSRNNRETIAQQLRNQEASSMKQLLFLFLYSWQLCVATQKPFVILIASYNNAQWFERNLASVFAQKYDNYRVIYIDDCSTDGTGQLVEDYIRDQKQSDWVTIEHNPQRLGHLCNQHTAIGTCKDDEIIIILDGDDWFFHDHVLERLNQIYQDPNVWLTYGQFKELSDDSIGYCQPIPESVLQAHAVRAHKPWVFGHVRTFYAGLFKRIKKEDLFYNNTFFPMAADVATMIPMAEMAGERIRFIKDVLYVHNDRNPLNLKKVFYMQAFYELVIRRRKPYDQLAFFYS